MKPVLSLVTLAVADLARATAFYRDGLGLPADASHPAVTFLRLQGAWIALFPRESLAAETGLPPGTGGTAVLAHNVASKEEVDAVLAQAQAAGARIIKAAADADWGGYCGYFADPDGHLWEVAWNPQFDLTFKPEAER